MPRVLSGSALSLKGWVNQLGKLSPMLVKILGIFTTIQGVIEVISRFSKSWSSGTLLSGFLDLTGLDTLAKADFGGFVKTWIANIAGFGGSIIDTLTGFSTDFGSQWRGAIKPADYKDAEAIRKGLDYQNLVGAAQANASLSYFDRITDFKRFAGAFDIGENVLQEFLTNFKLSEFKKSAVPVINEFKELSSRLSDVNYSEEQISIEYDRVREKLLELAQTFGLTQEEFDTYINKSLNNVNDNVVKLNNELRQLMPNMRALNDVFESSRKLIEENYEKHAGELQKIAQKISDVDTSVDVLAKGLNVSADQIAMWFSSPANFAEFEKLIYGGLYAFAEGIDEQLNKAIKDESFNIGQTSTKRELLEEFFSGLTMSNQNFYVHDAYESYKGTLPGFKYQAYFEPTSMDKIIELAENNADFAKRLMEAERKYGKTSGLVGFTDIVANTEQVNARKNEERLKAYSDNLMNALLNLNGLDEAQRNKIRENEDKIRKEIKAKYSEFKDDPKAFSDFIVDELELIPKEMRSAVQTVAGSIHEANKGSIKFMKSLIDFSSTVNNLASEFKIGDIVSNKLQLAEVDYFKRQINQAFGMTNDSWLVDTIISGIAEDMRKKMSKSAITQKWMQAVKFINPSLDDKSAKNIIDSAFDPIISMVKAYDDFNKQFDKLTVLKHFNKMNYGGEMSAFNQYKDFGKKIIDDLKAQTIATKYGDKSFQALYSEFKTKLENGTSFEDIKNEFVSYYGDDAFNEFYKKFVEFDKLTKEFYTEIKELDFMKFTNRLKFGGDMSAFKQFKEVDSKKIAEIMGTELVEGTGVIFKDVFEYAVKNGNDALKKKLKEDYDDETVEYIYNQYANKEKEYEDVAKGSPFALQTQYKGIKKRIRDFVRNYEDAFLTPMQQFNKTEAILNKQLAKLKKQASEGTIDPDLANRVMENLDKVQKLNEDIMNIKVPTAITATEAVKSGSKEAFDIMSSMVFRDIYKVNTRQEKLQQKLVNEAKKANVYLKRSNQTIRGVATP